MPRGLDREQRARLLAACPADTPLGLRDRALLVAAMLTGRRRQELADLRRGSLEGTEGRVYYRVRTKGGKEAHRELPGAAWELVRAYWRARLDPGQQLGLPPCWRGENKLWPRARAVEDLPPEARLFSLRADAVYLVARRRAREAGLGRLGIHALRHTAALIRDELGESLRSIQDLLGHESVVYSDRYLRRLRGVEDPGGDAAGAYLLGLQARPERE